MQKDGAAAAVRLLLLACTPRPPSSSDETAARLDLWQDAATRPNNDDTPLVTLPSYEKHLFNRTPIIIDFFRICHRSANEKLRRRQ